MLWILFPLLLATLLMEFYFERYIEEELGWNTAFGNSLILLFVSIDLIRTLHNTGMLDLNPKFAFVISVIFMGTIVTMLDFFHALPKTWAFIISSRLPVNCLAIAAVIMVYTNVPLDYVTFTALTIITIGIYALIRLGSTLIPSKTEE